MKSKLLLSLLLLSFYYVSATDRIVQENGAAGTFSTITAAIAASVNGDRVIVHPKIGGNPYVENITIDKTLEIASAEDGVRYKIQGNITLQALNNRTITIIGAHITTGSISGATAGWRTNVNIMGCIIEGGSISLSNQYYGTIVSNILENGSISISHGRIVGNELLNDGTFISINNSTSITDDTINIVANKVASISCSSDVFLNIYNNLIRKVSGVNGFRSIRYDFVSSTANKLNIINNTIILSNSASGGSSYNYYLDLKSPAFVKNTIFYRVNNGLSVAPNFFFGSGITVTASYNYYRTVSVVIPSEVNPVNLTADPVDIATGQLILPTAALNGADPSFQFYDLDLSIGDAGCYGGSYSLDNYFPITGSSRVFWVDMPFGITTNGAPLQIKAEGFDR
jgi:hypothetical protein